MSDIYKIGVALMLTQNGIAPALSLISHQLLGVHKSVSQINSGFGRWKTALVGVAGVMVGSGLIGGFAKIAEHGKELLDQQNKLIRAGRTHAEVAQLTADAYQRITKAVPTATGADVLRVANELTFVKGDFSKASSAATNALKIEAIVGNSTGKSAEGQGYNMWRALEEKLVTQDEAHTDKLLGLMTAGVIGSGGKITGRDWQTFAKRAGVSWIKANDEFVSSVAPTLINSLGADTAGTSYMTAYQSLMGAGTLSKQQLEVLQRLHLIDPSKVTTDKGGRVNVKPGGIVGSLENSGNLAAWGESVLGPALNQYVPESERESVLAKLGRNRNTTRMWETFTNPAGIQQMKKDAALISGAQPLNTAYGEYIKNNPKGVEDAYNKQKESMLQAIGAPMMQMAIPVMQGITTMFNNIGAFAQAHPEAIKVIAGGIAALGAVLIAAGGVAVLSAFGVSGGLAAGFVLAGAAVTAFLLKWNNFVAAFQSSMVGKWLGFGNGTTAPPATTSPGNGEMSGDVYFDSDKMGRWMGKASRRLSEHSITGPALFDPATAATPNDSAFAIP